MSKRETPMPKTPPAERTQRQAAEAHLSSGEGTK